MKIKCIYHRVDLDGWCSAAIVKKYLLEQQYAEDIIELIGYNYKDELPNTEADILFLCDLSFDPDMMKALLEKYGTKFIWIDHHVSAINKNKDLKISGKQSTKYAACELTWNYLYPDRKLPLGLKYLGMYDSFRHKGTADEERVFWFQYYARSVCNSPETVNPDWLENNVDRIKINKCVEDGKLIYNYLKIEASNKYKRGVEINFPAVTSTDNIIEAALVVDNFESHKFICINDERFNPATFDINYHADGYDGAACFWLDQNKKWNFSLYNDNGKVDCSKIAQQYGGGGHKGASGFVTDNIDQFFKNE